MTAFWDHVYHGIRKDILPKAFLLEFISYLHDLDHATDHGFTDNILKDMPDDLYRAIMDVNIDGA